MDTLLTHALPAVLPAGPPEAQSAQLQRLIAELRDARVQLEQACAAGEAVSERLGAALDASLDALLDG